MNWTVDSVISQLQATDENERIEAKSGLGDAAMKSVSSFSNEPGLRGGWIVFGARRDDMSGRYAFEGVRDADRLQTEFVTQCASRFNRVLRPEIRTDTVNGRRVVVAFIPEAPAADKPVFLKKQGLPKGAYRRIGSVDQSATDDDLHRFMSLAQSVPFDRRPVAGARREDLDDAAIETYRRELRARKPASELLDLSNDELLRALGALDDRVHPPTPTYAGLVLFGTRLALRRLLPASRVDVLRLESADAIDDYRVVELREALVTGWRGVVRAVLDGLPRRVTLAAESLQRTETSRIPDVVLREAIVNALMHRDLEVASPIQIRSQPDRLEIENPGYSLLQPPDWGQLRSEARNPTLAAMLHEIDLAETRGTGIRRMRKRMQAAGLPAPGLQSDRAANRFLLSLSFHHLLDEADWDWLAQFSAVDDVDRQVLWLALRREGVRNEDVRDVAGDDTLSASQRLSRLRDRGYLERHGAAKQHAYYIIPEDLRPTSRRATEDGILTTEGSQAEGASPEPVNLSGQPVNLGGQPVDLRGQPVNLSGQPVDPSGRPGQLAPSTLRSPDLPAHLGQRIAALPGKAPRAEVEALLVEVCRLGWWEPGELARAVGRSRSYLLGGFLKPLVDRGALVLKYPDRKHHPRQAYRAPTEGAGQP